MSEKTRKAEQRKLRKAVGDDAMALMAATANMHAEAKGAIFQLQQRIEEQDARIAQLEYRLRESLEAWREPLNEWPTPQPDQRVGAEVV